jgi:AraC-like DNA-binding protein
MKPSRTFSLPAQMPSLAQIDVATLCRRAGVAVSGPWSTEAFFRIWSAADAAIDDRSAGLRLGAEGIQRGYGVASQVALHAPTFRKALHALGRYKQLTCPETVEVSIAGDEAVVRYRWLEATGPVPRLLVDMTMASLLQLAATGSGGAIRPIGLQLARPAADQDLLRRHFGCPIVFSAESDGMVFSASALDAAFQGADRSAFENLVADLEAKLAGGDGFASLLSNLRNAIAGQLSPGSEPGLAAVARRMNLSTRTLQRRLRESGTSFQEQLNTVRRTIAHRLLVNTDLDAVAIAMLLGFEEPNSFARAFRAWDRTTPMRWRQQRAARHDHSPGLAT